MATITFIRHGESTDNVKRVWAGWKDAPLSKHGMKQANALGTWFVSNKTHFDTIFSSTLSRADATAQAIQDLQSEPKPPHIKSPLLREQNFGIAEGKSYKKVKDPNLSLSEHYAQGIFPSLRLRSDKFPEGESKDDLAARAERVINELLLPYLLESRAAGKHTILHIAVVSHGLFIRELVDALVKRNVGSMRTLNIYKGLHNTAWTRVTIGLQHPPVDSGHSPYAPTLIVQVTDVNRHEHLESLARQRGGIGSMAHDPKQKDIRGFFAGPSR